MPRYAAIDIGSNSVRMLAAALGENNAQMQILAEDRQVTRLGSSVFRSGRIDPQALSFLCETLARMAATYRKLDVAAVRAVATSAVRDASNKEEFLEKTAQAIGSPVDIISGQEEARLIHLGIQLRWPQVGQEFMGIDVGGGSAELIFSGKGQLEQAFSKPLGAVRLAEVFLKSDPPTPLELHRMRHYIDEKLRAPLRTVGVRKFPRVVATSATAAAIVCAVNGIPRPHRDEADRKRASLAQIRKFFNEVSTLTVAERRKVPGVGPRRAELIVSGTAVFLRILENFQLPALYYSAAGVRDGIVADLAARGVGRETTMLSRDQRKAVEQMARRYGVQLSHARKVAALGQRLFVALQDLHNLPGPYGKLLEASAYLHDIGHFVSATSHHKHSAYLVANSDMPGFTDSERAIIAALCRYHRKSMPSNRHPPFQLLETESRRAVTLLSPLLRLADSLDRSHQQHVQDIAVKSRNGTVILQIDSKTDVDLDVWAAQSNADIFREVYQQPLAVSKWKKETPKATDS